MVLVQIIIECKECKVNYEFILTKDQFDKVKSGEGYILDILPNLTPDERELFISGICGTCFDKIFGEG